jgi:hypothetical protein
MAAAQSNREDVVGKRVAPTIEDVRAATGSAPDQACQALYKEYMENNGTVFTDYSLPILLFPTETGLGWYTGEAAGLLSKRTKVEGPVEKYTYGQILRPKVGRDVRMFRFEREDAPNLEITFLSTGDSQAWDDVLSVILSHLT